MFDVNRIRQDFPILEEKIYGKPLVYLDNGATSQRPLPVIEKMTEYYLKYNSMYIAECIISVMYVRMLTKKPVVLCSVLFGQLRKKKLFLRGEQPKALI